jgi:hypothetical protein
MKKTHWWGIGGFVLGTFFGSKVFSLVKGAAGSL